MQACVEDIYSTVLFQSDEGSGRGGDAIDISRLSESLARATCLALIKLLDLLAQAGLTKLGVRATVHPENVSSSNWRSS
jgi:MAD (mothers against decapentaplegic) interacting protein